MGTVFGAILDHVFDRYGEFFILAGITLSGAVHPGWGLFALFGMLIATIACYQGLNVSGGAVGVGRATTATVVQCIVAIIGMDAVFTAVFYVFGV